MSRDIPCLETFATLNTKSRARCRPTNQNNFEQDINLSLHSLTNSLYQSQNNNNVLVCNFDCGCTMQLLKHCCYWLKRSIAGEGRSLQCHLPTTASTTARGRRPFVAGSLALSSARSKSKRTATRNETQQMWFR